MGLLNRKKSETGRMMLDNVSVTLLTVGGINWLPVAMGRMDFVATLTQNVPVVGTLVYWAVGASGLYVGIGFIVDMVRGKY